MTLRTPEILGALSGRFGDRVRTLRVTLGTISRRKAAEPRPRAVPPERLDAADRALIDDLVSAVTDPALADSMRRVLVKWRRSGGGGLGEMTRNAGARIAPGDFKSR